jgi:hypothetical protein
MSRYAVKLDLRTDRPLTAGQIAAVQGGRWDMRALGRPRGRRLAVSLSIDGGDVAGALIRAQNIVLEQVPGEVIHAEVRVTSGDDPVPRRPPVRS